MPESEVAVAPSQETKSGNNPRKRIRHRKKQLYADILKQMEFYFSDANLTKDRFLGELIKTDPYVPLEMFLKFNKIRSMTQDVNDILKAMKHSTFLEVSEDRTKVRRKTPVQQYNADLRTVYVESIPVTASREWLQRLFSEFGEVVYISLPKFKNSHKIKGYGFIEFSKPEDAQKCINTFNQLGCKLPTSMPPEELSSIKLFSIEEVQEETTDNTQKEEKEECEPPKKKKRKDKKNKNLDLKLEHEDGEKRLDTSTSSTPVEENKSITTPVDDEKKIITTPTTEESKPIDMDSTLDSKDEATSQDEDMDESGRKKKNRKKTKEKNKSQNNLAPRDVSKLALWGLQVLSKTEWKNLRNKYLNLQRKYMKEIKRDLRNNRHGYSGMPDPVASADAEPVINPQSTGAGAANTPAPLERIPGVFVKEVLPEPCLDPRLTKRTVRSNIHALHVEAKEGQSEIVIRFDSAKAADDYCEQSSNRARVLSGGEEEEQWSLATSARCMKRSRGRNVLLKRHDNSAPTPAPLTPAAPQPTHTHIRFDDE